MKVDMNTTLNKAWKSYETEVLDPVCAGKVQRQECRRAFYAGARVLVDLLNVVGGEDVQEMEGVLRLSIVAGEVEEFLKDMNEGRA